MKIRWNQWIAGCFLLGILSKGYAVNWTPEEDDVMLEFIQAKQVDRTLGWQDCANRVNAYRLGLGLSPIRTAEGCCSRWTHFVKRNHPELELSPNLRRYFWTKNKNDQLVELVERNTNDERTDWEAVSQEMGDRTIAQCRAHYVRLTSHGLPFEETPADDRLASHEFPHEETPADIPTHESFEPTYEGFGNSFWGSPLLPSEETPGFTSAETPADIPPHEGFENPFWGSLLEDY
jgi:hypothetical protein